jgi:ornithine carbamoyltransferase
MLVAAATGSAVSVATPEGYEPDPEVAAKASAIAERTGASVTVTNDPVAAVKGASAVYTDVWASMGQEDEAAARKRIFAPYQVNERLFKHTAKNAVFLHCLPAHRDDEVTAAVIDSPRSVVFDQAENRLHVQKAILLMLLGGGMHRMAKRSAHA